MMMIITAEKKQLHEQRNREIAEIALSSSREREAWIAHERFSLGLFDYDFLLLL